MFFPFKTLNPLAARPPTERLDNFVKYRFYPYMFCVHFIFILYHFITLKYIPLAIALINWLWLWQPGASCGPESNSWEKQAVDMTFPSHIYAATVTLMSRQVKSDLFKKTGKSSISTQEEEGGGGWRCNNAAWWAPVEPSVFWLKPATPDVKSRACQQAYLFHFIGISCRWVSVTRE